MIAPKPSLPVLRLFAALLVSAAPLPATPLITEFLASNANGIKDEDGDRPDWIEIYNPDGTDLNLGGYHLTDDPARPTRWTVPAGVIIPPRGYLVIFASGENRTIPGSPLHTDFKLEKSGEYLGLFAPGGTGPAVSEYTERRRQSNDISYGLTRPEPFAATGYFTIPTPGTANTVQFSLRSRTFNQGSPLRSPSIVALSFYSPTATIRYTTNRAVPIAAPGITGDFTADMNTDVLAMPAHGLSDRDEVQVATTGTLPGGLGAGLNYYVINVTEDTLQLLTADGLQFLDGPQPELATPVDITSSGTGTHSLRHHAAIFTAPASGTSMTITEHRFYDRDEVQVSSTGTLPAGLTPGTTFYTGILNRNALTFSATPGGAAINVTSAGSGTHTLRRMPSPLYSNPISVTYSMRIRARAFEPGLPDGPVGSESYVMLDAAAQAFTSTLPIMILHSWGSGHPSPSIPTGTTPEDTKEAVWLVFEPKLEYTGISQVRIARMTNLPDLATVAYFERRGADTFAEQKYSMTMGAWDESRAGKIVSPLGFSSNDDFILDAPYRFDRSLVNNDLMYRLSNEIGRYAPRTRHVEIFTSVNNDVAASGTNPAYGVVTGAVTSADYYGVYSFQDKISRGKNRVDIEKLTPEDNTLPDVQGGYLFKIDRLDAGDSGLAAGGRTFALVQPKEYSSFPSHLQVMTNPQKTYLAGVLNAMYASCTSADFMSPALGYQAHLDVPAALDHFTLNVAAKNADAFRLGGYWHKSRYGKLVMGPVFDFDRAMGSTDVRVLNPLTWRGDVPDFGTDYFHNAGIYSPNYFHYMFRDPNFWQAWIDRLHELRTGVLSTAHVHAVIDEYTELLDPGNSFLNPLLSTPAKRNFQRFPGNGVVPRPANASTPGTNGTFRGEMQWLKNWWGKAGAVTANGRLDFMDGQFTRPATSTPSDGPIVPSTRVALTSPSLSTPGAKIYYTTDGTDPRRPAATPGGFATIATPLPENSTVRAIVPTSGATGGATGVEWRGENFEDSAWYTNAAGTINGVGYDDATAVADFLPYINLRWNTPGFGTAVTPVDPSNVMKSGTIGNTTYNGNQTCFIRLPFTLTAADIANLVPPNKLILQIRYDDGFVAWLNGVELTSARSNAPATNALTFDSAATNQRADVASLGYVDFDISAFSGNAHAGPNVLAIQGLNFGLPSSDFLCQARLVIHAPLRSSTAVEYSGPITINEPTQLFIRTLHPNAPSDPPTQNGGGTGPVPNGSSWSAPTRLYYFPGAVSASQARIKITEVLYHPNPPTEAEMAAGWTNSNDFEFIRLTNTGPLPVDLTGIYFSNGLEFTAVPGLQNLLPAGQSVVVVENIRAFIFRHGTSFTILGEFKGELDDGGEHIVLNDKTGAVISNFRYGDSYPWPPSADNGYSLVYISGDPNLAGSWGASVDPVGAGSTATTFSTSYARWLLCHFSHSEISSQPMSQDDDGDGLNNFGEYVFATDPRIPGSDEHAMGWVISGNPPRLAVRRRSGITDVTWIFETATTPLAWTPSGSPPDLIFDNRDGTELVIWRAAATPGTRVFMRVRATSP